MDYLNDRALVYQLLNNKKPRPHSQLGLNYSATYTPPEHLKKMQYQSQNCCFQTDSIDTAVFMPYGSGCRSEKELIGGKYLAFLPLD